MDYVGIHSDLSSCITTTLKSLNRVPACMAGVMAYVKPLGYNYYGIQENEKMQPESNNTAATRECATVPSLRHGATFYTPALSVPVSPQCDITADMCSLDYYNTTRFDWIGF